MKTVYMHICVCVCACKGKEVMAITCNLKSVTNYESDGHACKVPESWDFNLANRG